MSFNKNLRFSITLKPESLSMTSSSKKAVNKLLNTITVGLTELEDYLNHGGSLTEQHVETIAYVNKVCNRIRLTDICMLRDDGVPLSEIGRKWNITSARVSQLSRRCKEQIK